MYKPNKIFCKNTNIFCKIYIINSKVVKIIKTTFVSFFAKIILHIKMLKI
jgi:hypothetical protein